MKTKGFGPFFRRSCMLTILEQRLRRLRANPDIRRSDCLENEHRVRMRELYYDPHCGTQEERKFTASMREAWHAHWQQRRRK